MKKRIKECLFKFFNGQVTLIDAEILQAFRMSKDLTRHIVRHYFSGGSYKQAQFLFFVSEATYYRHIRRMTKLLEKLTKSRYASMVKFN